MAVHSEVIRLDNPNASVLLRWDNIWDDPTADIGSRARAMRNKACTKEPWTTAFIEQLPPNSTLYDIGANVGSYSLLAAALGHSVIALEPFPMNYERLVENIQFNHFADRILPLPVAVAGQNRWDWLQVVDREGWTAGSASFVIGQAPGNQPMLIRRTPIMVFTLDTLIEQFRLPVPTHIKLDIDGNEPQALGGATKALASASAMMAEFKPSQEEAILADLVSRGFELRGRWDERQGQKIGVVYCYLVRNG